jgi:hypothetical protein
MPASVFVPGLIAVSVKKPADQNFSLLGYCRDGVMIRETVRMRPIHGDEGGGPDGIPVDFSYLGEYHEVRLDLYKYDGAMVAAISNRLSTTNKSRTKVFEPGWMIRAAGDEFQLKLETEYRFVSGHPPVFSRIYNCAIPTQPIEYPVGPKEMNVLIEFLCLPDATGTIFTVPV